MIETALTEETQETVKAIQEAVAKTEPMEFGNDMNTILASFLKDHRWVGNAVSDKLRKFRQEIATAIRGPPKLVAALLLKPDYVEWTRVRRLGQQVEGRSVR